MAITTSDITFFLSGGATNSDPDASLGGVISTTEVTDDTLNNLFDVVSGSEAETGETEYRAFYITNEHGTLTLYDAKVWIYSDTPSTDTDISVGIEGSVGSPIQTVADEDTAPVTTSFKDASGDSGKWLTTAETAGDTYYTSIGNLAPGETIGVWVKRVVDASASAYANDNCVLKVQGDTEA